jgi:hypothetical protein
MAVFTNSQPETRGIDETPTAICPHDVPSERNSSFGCGGDTPRGKGVMDLNKTHQAWLEGVHANDDIDVLFESTLGVFADEDIAKELFGTTNGECTPSMAITSIGYNRDTPGGNGVRINIQGYFNEMKRMIEENTNKMIRMIEENTRMFEENNRRIEEAIDQGIKEGFRRGFESLRLKANLDNGAQPTVRETQDLLLFDIFQQIPTFDFSSTPSHPFTMTDKLSSSYSCHCHNTSTKYDFMPREGISEHDIEGCMKLHDIKGWLKQQSTTSFKHLYHGVIGGMKVHDLTGWLKRIYFMI